MKENNNVKITGMIVGAVIILALIFSLTLSNQNQEDSKITVSGESTLEFEADLTILNFRAETSNDDSQIAKDENSVISDKITSSLIALGYSKDEIETVSFNVYEDYDWTETGRIPKGYKATHSFKIEIPKEKESGNVIDAIIDNGGLISYVSFELTDEHSEEYKTEALKLATQNAREKAEAMADGLGAKLGNIISVSDSYSFPYMYGEGRMELDMASSVSSVKTQINPSNQNVYATVSVTYKLK